jgi:small conductance mechanosensitive channel
MHVLSILRERLSDGPLLPNLIAITAVAIAVQVPSWILRRLLRGCGGRLGGWTGSDRLGAAGQEAARQVEAVLFWLTMLAVLTTIAAGAVYHLAGRDVRTDLGDWAAQRTTTELVASGLRLGGLTLILVTLWVFVSCVRRLRPRLEASASAQLGRPGGEENLRRGFALLQQFAVVGGCLLAAWAAGRVLGLGATADASGRVGLWLLLLWAAVRLLPPAARVFAGAAVALGDHHLGGGRFARYWERASRLVPFGLRCFEAAVYLYAAALALREIGLVRLAEYGPKLVTCTGLFFGCRVAIELTQVLLGEVFGVNDERRPADPKGQTLVPLLQSVCQYLLYFGTGVVMLGVLGVNTGPILAGAGLLGLAVGLGSQSLVSDVVSGFFILLEGQYLVGDQVQIGDATGRVEAFSIRYTQVRDAQGKLHLIPNGAIRGVVSASKGYVNAVVDLKLPAGADLDGHLEAMREAGRRLRRQHGEGVLADTHVHGLVELGPSEMTARAVTKVRPGAHELMENEYRRHLKQVLDERPSAAAVRPAA